jgi:hypothetical protein
MIFWKRKVGDSTFRLWANTNQSGYLTKNNWTGNAVGEWGQKRYYFLRKGFFRISYVVFIDENPENIVASIKFSDFKTKALIKVAGSDTYHWQSDDVLGLKNSVWKSGIKVLSFRRKWRYGEVEFLERLKKDGTLILLSGLLSQNYFSRWLLIMALLILLISSLYMQ